MLIERKILNEIRLYLKTPDVIVIHGARQTGKTSLLKIIQNELPKEHCHYFDLEDSRYKMLFEEGPEAVVNHLKQKGLYKPEVKNYLFTDEIQHLTDPSSFLKLAHDHHPGLKMIVSGSSSFEIKSKFSDTLTGRTVNFELFPLDFEEFLWFKKRRYNFQKLITDAVLTGELKKLYTEYTVFGGYPKITLTDNVDMKEKYLQQIIDSYIKGDIRDIARIRHTDKFNKLLIVLAGQSGQLLNMSELSNTSKIARQTVEEYLFILQQTYILKLIQPYSGNIRSELFRTPKIFFYDTGLMNMLSKKMLPSTIDGTSFETAVFSDLVKNHGHQNLNYWRTTDKKEIDFILTQRNNVRPLEVKINANRFNYTPVKYFHQKYNCGPAYCICIEGELPKKDLSVKQIFPWDIYSISGDQ